MANLPVMVVYKIGAPRVSEAPKYIPAHSIYKTWHILCVKLPHISLINSLVTLGY